MFSKMMLLAVVLCLGALVNGQFVDDEVKTTRPRYHVDILRLNTTDDTLEHVCDGAILDRRHVLTAAHCVFDQTTAVLRVRSGSDVAPPPSLPHQEERLFHKVNKIMYLQDYVQTPCRQHQHDIAIIKVARSFDLAFDKLYKQVYLPEPSNDYESYEALLSGYSNANTLNTIEAQVISNEECARNASSIITSGNLCAVFSEANKYKISGSPLVHENTILGVLNAPAACNSETPLSIKCVPQAENLKLYTRITAYLDFVEKVLNNKPSADIVYRS